MLFVRRRVEMEEGMGAGNKTIRERWRAQEL